MKELVRFSLFRRFNNRSTKIFNIIIFVVIALVAFSDKLMKIVDPTMFDKEVIYVRNIDSSLVDFLQENAQDTYTFKEAKKIDKALNDEGKMVLSKSKDDFIISSKYEVSPNTIAAFEMQINRYRKDELMKREENIEVLNEYNQDIAISNKVSMKKVDISQEKSSLIFMFVTSIYFMMLSFVSGVASEVVNEKATKTLELILTSVNARTHFYSKLLVGWLVIVVQMVASLSYILFWILLRSVYDQGVGLLSFINKIGIAKLNGKTFYAVLANFDFTSSFFMKLFYVLLFLMLGILLIQLVLVIVSSFVSSIEEAGNIQAPFYLLLLGFYYLTLAINNPHDLNEGIGFYLSFVPFLNMLLMPCRLLVSEVPLTQMLISIAISGYLIYIVLKKGSKIYERGVLDYSCKGFIQVMKSMAIKN